MRIHRDLSLRRKAVRRLTVQNLNVSGLLAFGLLLRNCAEGEHIDEQRRHQQPYRYLFHRCLFLFAEQRGIFQLI